MYEFVAAITCMAVLSLVAASVRFRAYYMGLFVLLPVVLALGIDLTVIYTPAGSLVPALQSYWIAIHVTAMIVASGLFIFGAVVTTMYLLADRSRAPRRGGPALADGGHPDAPAHDHDPGPAVVPVDPVRVPGLDVRGHGGAIWADHAWGRYWGWDPKETWSFITWVVYAGSCTPGRRPAGAAARRPASTWSASPA